MHMINFFNSDGGVGVMISFRQFGDVFLLLNDSGQWSSGAYQSFHRWLCVCVCFF